MSEFGDDLRSLARRASDLAKAGDLRGAIEVHERILDLYRHDLGVAFTAHGQIADLRMKLHQPHLAEPHLREALAINPRAAPYLSLLGLAQGLLGKLEESTASHKAAIELLPDNPEPLRMFGQSLAAAGLLQEAENVLLDSLRVGRDHIPTYVSLAKLLVLRGKFSEARQLLEAALNDRPGDELLAGELRSLEAQALRVQGMRSW
jgi:tetratricopeptide (TPR) repeat protein